MGLTFADWITFAGLLLGPVCAVALTLLIENGRRVREQQLQVVRLLLNTRHLPADPGYSVAINLVPVEFDKNRAVMDAWKDYIEVARFAPGAENEVEHHNLLLTKQTALIFRMMRHLGFRLTEGDIRSSAYASQAFAERERMQVEAMKAWPRIATALESQLEGAPETE